MSGRISTARRRLAAACGACVFTFLATPAPAQLVVSYSYDGIYIGGSSLMHDLSDPACPGLPLNRIEIRDGALRAWDGARQTVKGVITHDGFFNADYYFSHEPGHVFEGSIDRNGALVGGVFHQRCAWIVKLHKSRSGAP